MIPEYFLIPAIRKKNQKNWACILKILEKLYTCRIFLIPAEIFWSLTYHKKKMLLYFMKAEKLAESVNTDMNEISWWSS
jgi:hypothetical protein